MATKMLPKRGIKNITLSFANREITFKPHHQKTLLIELLEFKGGTATVKDIVELIEADDAKMNRLDTVQPVYNCVVYHAKQLRDSGYLNWKENGVENPKTNEGNNVQLLIDSSNSKLRREEEINKALELQKITEESFGEFLMEERSLVEELHQPVLLEEGTQDECQEQQNTQKAQQTEQQESRQEAA